MAATPMTATAYLVSELAARIDMPAQDIIDAAWLAGISPLWLDGGRFYDRAYLATVTRLHGREGDVEIDADDAALERMAEKLGVGVAELREARS